MQSKLSLEKEYDVILYGATGFVGEQAAVYLANHAQAQRLRWAIAGRNRSKLEQVKQQLGSGATAVPLLVADSHDQAAVDAMVAQTRVLLSTAGPYARFGLPIVDACVRFQTDYVDITGETVWVRELIDRYHPQARTMGTRIIPCCGFDSVPGDLGSYLLVRHMQMTLGTNCQDIQAYYQMSGGLNGGTIASALYRYEAGHINSSRDPFLLNPKGTHPLEELEQNRDPMHVKFDPSVGTWVGPFVMGPINTRVVRRSAALFAEWGEPYSPHFHYQEYLKYNPPLALAKAALVTGALSLFAVAIDLPLTRHLLQPMLPQPGTGPSEQTMNSGWFSTELIGTGVDGQQVKTLLRFRGDPGNRATVCFVCESALSLALDSAALPGGAQRGGILTPATGLGDVLVERLRSAGLTIKSRKIKQPQA
jgi:short subunit dehydrogenase-like uncharacterized protein